MIHVLCIVCKDLLYLLELYIDFHTCSSCFTRPVYIGKLNWNGRCQACVLAIRYQCEDSNSYLHNQMTLGKGLCKPCLSCHITCLHSRIKGLVNGTLYV